MNVENVTPGVCNEIAKTLFNKEGLGDPFTSYEMFVASCCIDASKLTSRRIIEERSKLVGGILLEAFRVFPLGGRVGKAIEKAAEKLPKGWFVDIGIEGGGYSVSLYDPDGDEIDMPPSESLHEDIENAVAEAVSLQALEDSEEK